MSDFLESVLRVFAFEWCDELWWSDRQEDGKLRLYADCSDFFHWATSDVEEIEGEEDLALLVRSKQDVQAALGAELVGHWPSLYCARKRGMRPQGAIYELLPKEIWHLFDACGPERETGFGNPRARPEDPA